MFREINHARTEALIDYIRILPENEQKAIVSGISDFKGKKKLTKKQKNTQQVLKGIAEGLKEIKEAKRTGKPMKTLEEFLDEI